MKSKYTYEECKRIASGCKSRNEFKHKCPGAISSWSVRCSDTAHR